MTAKEFYDLWPLWVYLSGFVTTFIGAFAKGAYENDIIDDADYIFPATGAAAIWPLTWLYFGGKGIGLYLKAREEKALEKKREQKLLADKQAKLLKEAGLDA